MPGLATPSDYVQSHDVQVPTLGNINIPVLIASSSPTGLGAQHINRPFLQRIDTDVALRSPDMPAQTERRVIGHRHSRSLENPSATYFIPTDTINSASSESFVLSPPKRNSIPHSNSVIPLPGLYISQSSRNVAGCKGVPVSSSPYALPPLTPSPGPSSPVNDLSEDSTSVDDESDTEDVWDLVPYDISWGSSYFGYRDGTLPGPDGKCIFLRSPTPLKYQRTGQACEKCRERKAKCSGTRPSCSRCIARGHVCEYAPEAKRSRADELANEEEGDSIASLIQGLPDSYMSGPPSHRRFATAIKERPRSNTGQHSRRDSLYPPISRTSAPAKSPLRRRHSTIELPVSLPLSFPDKMKSAPRDARPLSRESGYLRLPSGFSEGDVRDDDLYLAGYPPTTSCSTDLSDRSLYTASASSSVPPLDIPTSTFSEFHISRQDAPRQAAWGASLTATKDSTMDQMSCMPSDFSRTSQPDISEEDHYGPNVLRYSASVPELGWAYQAPHITGSNSFTYSFSDTDSAELDFEMADSNSLWSLSKASAEANVYSFDNIPSHVDIDVMEHSGNYFSFDQQMDAMAAALGTSSHLAFSMQSV
ncbi:hypothetical protein M0805_002272 [Coniferiporia weirii]|nr:hypothetical protein M0805_002272 [Coniferiporia weirii]